MHNDYYVLSGAHNGIANECALCHDGNYNATPTPATPVIQKIITLPIILHMKNCSFLLNVFECHDEKCLDAGNF